MTTIPSDIISHIKKQKDYIVYLKQSLKQAEQELTEFLIESSGHTVGETITYRGEKYLIQRIEPNYASFWLYVHPMKADGSFSNSVRTINSSYIGKDQ